MRLPIYQHPSLTVLVDDSEAFLARLQFELGAAVISKAFSDPRKALAGCAGKQASTPREQLLSASVCDGACMHPHCSVTLDVDRIFRIGFRPQRFMLPSVLVVDYRMAKMNGVEFCAALADLPCKKILLVGRRRRARRARCLQPRPDRPRHRQGRRRCARPADATRSRRCSSSTSPSCRTRCARCWCCTVSASSAIRRSPAWCATSAANTASSNITCTRSRAACCCSMPPAAPG